MEHNDPAWTFATTLKVRDYEVDCQGIVNNANYLHYLEHTRHEFCEWAGLSFRDMHAQGIDPVVRRIDIEYLVPLRLGMTFTSRLRVERRGARFVFVQEILHHPSGLLSARAEVTVVTLQDGRLTRGDVLFEAFSRFLSPQA